MKARSSDGPAGMVFDAVFNTPDVGAAALVPETPRQPVEPPKQEVGSSSSIKSAKFPAQPDLPKVDVESNVAVVEESSLADATEPVKEEPAPATPVPPVVTVVQVGQAFLFKI